MGSSKTVCRERRRAANKKKYKRLTKLGWVPQHTHEERIKAAAERRARDVIEQRHHVWHRRTAGVALAGVGVPAFMFSTPTVTQVVAGHYLDVPIARINAAVTPPTADRDDLPHTPEPSGTNWTPYDGSGSTTPTMRANPAGLVWYGYGPNRLPDLFGD